MPAKTTDAAMGIVYIVGAGPGDPALITVRGRDLIARADAIVFDSSASRSLLPENARATGYPELYYVGRRRTDSQKIIQQEIQELLVQLGRAGKRVVRLSGGDPFVFGSGADEAQALYDASVPFEIVPGVTAGIAAVSYAGIPVTHRGMSSSVTFVSGKEIPGRATTGTNWAALAKAGGTLVIYMGVKALDEIVAALLEGGMPEEMPAAAVERGTSKRQRTITATLGTLAGAVRSASLSGPTILILGWPVLLRDEMSWFEKRPLFGRRIILADSGPGSIAIGERVRELGAEVLEVPEESLARLDLSQLREEFTRLIDFQWVVFATRKAVTIFWEQLLGSGRDSRALSGLSVAAANADAAGALLEHGIAVDVIPPRFTVDALLEKMGDRDDVSGSRILLVAPEGAADLTKELETLGADVTLIAAYRSIRDETGVRRFRRKMERESAQAVVFTSVPGVRAYAAAAGENLTSSSPAVSMSAQVTDALTDEGIEILAEAEEPTTESLLAALERALK
jgi:uroporphyrinogen III methyltransferase/synthase